MQRRRPLWTGEETRSQQWDQTFLIQAYGAAPSGSEHTGGHQAEHDELDKEARSRHLLMEQNYCYYRLAAPRHERQEEEEEEEVLSTSPQDNSSTAI